MDPSVKPEPAQGEEYFEANLPEMAFDDSSINDLDLLVAHRQSIESGSLTPLLKQELRYKIQARRLTEGKDELSVNFDSPQSCQVNQCCVLCAAGMHYVLGLPSAGTQSWEGYPEVTRRKSEGCPPPHTAPP